MPQLPTVANCILSAQGNILIDSHGRVLLCDFGISLDWSNSENSTTEGAPHKFTSRYCAPEIQEHDKRNTTSDVWSLGCVFLEIITVIKGYTLGEFNEFLLENSHSESALGLWCAPDAMTAWLVKLRSKDNNSADDLPLEWITPMVRLFASQLFIFFLFAVAIVFQHLLYKSTSTFTWLV